MNKVQTASPTQVNGLPRWLDWLIVLVVITISGTSLLYAYLIGAFNLALTDTAQWSWYLVRSTGLLAYMLLAASLMWGLVLASHVFKNWTPGPLSMLLHATTSWLAVVLSAAHALLLLIDKHFTYTINDLLIPFAGSYRTVATGLGLTAFWLMAAIAVSFSLRKLIGKRAWRWLHLTSYISFGMATSHVLLAGSDVSLMSVRMIILCAVIGVVALYGWRWIRDRRERPTQ